MTCIFGYSCARMELDVHFWIIISDDTIFTSTLIKKIAVICKLKLNSIENAVNRQNSTEIQAFRGILHLIQCNMQSKSAIRPGSEWSRLDSASELFTARLLLASRLEKIESSEQERLNSTRLKSTSIANFLFLICKLNETRICIPVVISQCKLFQCIN